MDKNNLKRGEENFNTIKRCREEIKRLLAYIEPLFYSLVCRNYYYAVPLAGENKSIRACHPTFKCINIHDF
jgi:hypothetical protein